MLAHVRGAETVRADIETLDLGRTFPVVLLASNFLNAPAQEELDAVLAACARHVESGGRVLLERMRPLANPETRTAGGIEMTLRDVEHDGEIISAVMEYRAGGERWTHAFRTKLISDDDVDAAPRASWARASGRRATDLAGGAAVRPPRGAGD